MYLLLPRKVPSIKLVSLQDEQICKNHIANHPIQTSEVNLGKKNGIYEIMRFKLKAESK